MEFKISDGIALISLLISLGAVYFAKASSRQANRIAQENLNLQHGMVELEISQSIEGAKSGINEISIVMVPYVAKEEDKSLTKEEAAVLELYRKNFNAATQTLMNYYDSAMFKIHRWQGR